MFKKLFRNYQLPPGPTVTIPKLVLTRYRIIMSVMVVIGGLCFFSAIKSYRMILQQKRIIDHMVDVSERANRLATQYREQMDHHVNIQSLWVKTHASDGEARERYAAQYHLAISKYNQGAEEIIEDCDWLRSKIKDLLKLYREIEQ